MKFSFNHNVLFIILASLPYISGQSSSNFSCYQCVRNAYIECEPFELKPCPSVSDRCVTQFSKTAESGFSLKRECGLGPCTFDDDMVNKGLGFTNCDRSRDEYFCVFCCRESGCNKSKAQSCTSSLMLLLTMMVVIFCWKNKNW